jgi:hypothetical protein
VTVRVGIIDSGIPPTAAATGSGTAHEGRDFTAHGDLGDRIGHGSAVFEAISSGSEAQMITAKIFADQLRCSPETLIAAIEWMAEQQVAIVNMSFGMAAADDRLAAAVATLQDSGALCIAAAPAQGSPVYPSALPNVVRGTGDARCGPGTLSWLDSEQADFGAYPGQPGSGPAGASIGCAHVTQAAVQLLEEHPTMAAVDIPKALQNRARWHGPERRSGPA